jgi:hypothetical protein
MLNAGIGCRTSTEGLWRVVERWIQRYPAEWYEWEQCKCNRGGHTDDLFAGREGIIVLFLGWMAGQGEVRHRPGICCVSH